MLHSRFVLSGSSGNAHVAFTDSRGGYSHAPYASLNLALHVGDSADDVHANRAALASVLSLQADRMSFVSQVHGTDVAVIDETSLTGPPATADAQVTGSADLALAVLVADCVPVVLADPDAGVVGVAHAGRKGMAAGVVAETLTAMRAQGAESIRAAIGPSICPRCYEVPAQLRQEVAQVEPVTASVSAAGTPALDVAAGVAEQLHRAGVEIVDFSTECTRENTELFSYRRNQQTGRFAGLVWFEKTADTPAD